MIAAVQIEAEREDPAEFGAGEVLLLSCVGLLVILLLMVAGVRRRLKRIEKALATRTPQVPVTIAESAPPVSETSPGGAFEAFLMDDPARLKLPKREQFKAYRNWRQEKGMNWSNTASPEDP